MVGDAAQGSSGREDPRANSALGRKRAARGGLPAARSSTIARTGSLCSLARLTRRTGECLGSSRALVNLSNAMPSQALQVCDVEVAERVASTTRIVTAEDSVCALSTSTCGPSHPNGTSVSIIGTLDCGPARSSSSDRNAVASPVAQNLFWACDRIFHHPSSDLTAGDARRSELSYLGHERVRSAGRRQGCNDRRPA